MSQSKVDPERGGNQRRQAGWKGRTRGEKKRLAWRKKCRTKGQLRQAVGFLPLNLGLKASSWANAPRAGLTAQVLALASATP